MPDEEIDKLVKDAAGQHHPPYDDTAWGKMEVLLDKHLPQKKDRKKPILFLLLFLLLGGAVFFGIEMLQQNGKSTTAEKKTTPINKGPVTVVNNNSNENTIAAQQPATPAVDLTAAAPGINSGKMMQKNTRLKSNENDNEQYAAKNNIGYNKKGRLTIKVKKPAIGYEEENSSAQKNNPVDANGNINVIDPLPETANANSIVNNNDKKDKVIIKPGVDTANKAEPEKEKTIDKKITASSAEKQKKNKKTIADNIAITLSAGADVSFVDLKNAGKLKPSYGVGLSYTLGKHFTISSGFYIAKKIYTALPYQYKFLGGSSYPNLVKINADCNVYEIPLNVYYNFKQVKNHNWLAGVGLSSLLMKKESYNYLYKYPSGQAYSYNYSVSNENKHYFSVLTLSGGYQYKLNNRFSFIAEPYVKIPLSGIGVGKIKLNSTGLLFTAAIKPFAKKKK